MSQATEMQRQYLQNLKEEEAKELSLNRTLIDDFINFAKTLDIELTDEHFSYIRTIGIVAAKSGLLESLFNGCQKDKEGLYNFNDLTKDFELRQTMSGYFYHEKYMALAHPYFRRGLHYNSNFAPRLMEYFWGKDHSELEFKIALDPDRVRINVDDLAYLELDTWFGPKFQRSIKDINDGAVKLRPPLDINEGMISFLFKDVYSLDIKWNTDTKGIRVFQAEEIKTEKITLIINGVSYHPVRYIHAEFDPGEGSIRHFDGAIHLYTPQEYFIRRDGDLNFNSKGSTQIKAESKKLFKFNGSIDVDTWLEYCGQFMSGNPLVIEYFEGSYPDAIQHAVNAIRKMSIKS